MPSMRLTDGLEKTVDLLVVGTGPAGVACALQAKRDDLDVLVVGDEPVGGLIRAARRLDNLPAFPGISGVGLAVLLERHLELARVPVEPDRIVTLQAGNQLYRANGVKIGWVSARSICLATGTRPLDYELDTIHTPCMRDARLLPETLHNQKVVVVGGGEAALDTALTAKDRGACVTVLIRSDRLLSTKRLIQEAESAGVNFLFASRIERVAGGPGDWRIALCNHDAIAAHHLVACIGRAPCCGLLRQLTHRELVRSVLQPDLPGLYLAGDLIRGRQRYVAQAFGDGQRAALEAFRYLEEKKTCWIR